MRTRDLSAAALEERIAWAQQKLALGSLPQAAESYLLLSQLLENRKIAEHASTLVGFLRQVGSPYRALRAIEIALAQESGGAWLDYYDALKAMVLLCGASEWAARVLSKEPNRLDRYYQGFISSESESENYPFDLAKIVDSSDADLDLFDAQLRHYRQQAMLHIALRELDGGDIRSTALDLSRLADACLQASLDFHLPQLIEQVGAPEPPCKHLIVGMGKLGGEALNFSSDIDLIYLYEHDEGGAGELSQHQFHVKLFERVGASLHRQTQAGFVFRVDLDLRPEGRPGPLCNSLAGAERYYETWGRTWERAAWIKGRAVAGDLELIDQAQSFLRPFVYRRSVDLSVIKSVVDMKNRIDTSYRPSRRRIGKKALNLKLGQGGIREIEFFVVAYQLLFGGKQPHLRLKNTLDALLALEVAGHVSSRDRETLANTYLFLRKIEHRVQLVEDRQTHELPAHPEALLFIARSLEFETAEALLSQVKEQMQVVHDLFGQLSGNVEKGPEILPEALILMSQKQEESVQIETLEELAVDKPHTALAHLKTAARMTRSPFHPRATTAQRTIAAQFLSECMLSADIDRALFHLPNLVRALLIHGSYLQVLERPSLRRGVARVLGASDLLARILASNPGLLSEVILVRQLPELSSLRLLLKARLATCGTSFEEKLAALRLSKQEEVLRVAIADLAGNIEQFEVGLRMAALAEMMIDFCLDLAWQEMADKYGPPADPNARLVLVGGGTLGAREMGYRTDVDLSAIYTGNGETTGGERPAITISEFFTRVVQRTLSFLTMRMPQGDLYPVDMRLRPSGSQGALVTSLANFQNYHRQGKAQLWERQALVRSRVVAGDSSLWEEVTSSLQQATIGLEFAIPDPDKVVTMREKLRKKPERRRKKPAVELFDIKMGSGGLVEVEFATQFLVLRHARNYPVLLTSNTQEALQKLAAQEVLEAEEAQAIVEAHGRLRRLQNWLRIAHDEMIEYLDLSSSALRPLALTLGYEGEEAEDLLREQIDADRLSITAFYRKHLVEQFSGEVPLV